MNICAKIRRKLLTLRLRPIRVFCFHQVSETFDESTMWACDWMQIENFKRVITDLCEKGYVFVSLPEAYERLRHDWFRCRKYAVLTADDGDASLRNVLPWLRDMQIPVTLFINPVYLDGKHYRIRDTELYLTEDELQCLYKQYPLLTIGSHGWVHIDAEKQTEQEFAESLTRSINYLKVLPNYVPFFAFPYGHYTNAAYANVITENVIPVLIGGNTNYTYDKYIDREKLRL